MFLWSKELFKKINKQIGKRVWLDTLMIFCAKPLIYIMFLITLLWINFVLYNPLTNVASVFLVLLITAGTFAIMTSWAVSLLWHHSRPHVELPKSKQLVTTYQNFKSFPSDHTTLSFILVFVPLFMGQNLIYVLIMSFLASLVAVSRVYVGVHYPRDIIGGFFNALVFSMFSFGLAVSISFPLLNILF